MSWRSESALSSAYRPADDADDGRIRALLARREVVADCYRTLELVMPPLFHLAARCCSDEDLFALAQDAKRVDRSGVSEGWRISHASIVLHGLVAKAGNPLFTSCFASLERIGLVPVVPGFESPFASRAVDVDGGLMTWMFSSLLLRDADEVQYRFGCMYRGVAQRVGAYFDALENAYAPAVDIGSFGYAWNAKAGLEFVHGQIARNLVERIVRGEFVDGQLLPSIAELSAQYGVSAFHGAEKRTARSNVIGVARTVNGLGTRVQLGKCDVQRALAGRSLVQREMWARNVHAAQMMCAVLPAALSRVQGHAEEVASSAERALAVEEGVLGGVEGSHDGFDRMHGALRIADDSAGAERFAALGSLPYAVRGFARKRVRSLVSRKHRSRAGAQSRRRGVLPIDDRVLPPYAPVRARVSREGGYD